MRLPHDFSVGDWLKNGWILELGDSKVLIGGGSRANARPFDFARADGAIWTPGFFGPPDLPESTPEPRLASWVLKIERSALIEKILTYEASAIGSGKIENISRPKYRPTCKVVWTPPARPKFEETFQRLQKAFHEDGVKKAVPVVFSKGITATSQPEIWRIDRLLSGLQSTESSALRVYGSWSEDEGFLGATPEILFSLRDGVLISMAVAGTKALGLEALSGETAAVNERVLRLKAELESDTKERREHEIVVADIESVLSRWSPSIVKSHTRAERFGGLLHLVTDIKAQLTDVSGAESERLIENLVAGLHPTPALGVSPRDPSLKLLRELDRLSESSVARKNFGAPFVVAFENTVHALVSIRQIRWKHRGRDQIELVVGSGCGVVPESELSKEWQELESKRTAVANLFRLTPEVSRPVTWSLAAIDRLLALGVRTFVVCAGARNAPLVVALSAIEKKQAAPILKMESFFEERAAAFYALGLSRGSGAPVAIITTSGTAAAELLPAIAEADSSGVPLIAVTADRPHRLRGSGAPQSIPQQGLFSDFVESAWDIETGDGLHDLELVSFKRPLHINMAFEEPLLRDTETEPNLVDRRVDEIILKHGNSVGGRRSSDPASDGGPKADLSLAFTAMSDWLSNPDSKASGRVALVAGLHVSERDVVAKFLMAHRIPSVLEGTSGLRGDPRLKNLELIGGERDLSRWCASGEIKSVLRIGGVPTTRLWRDLDEPDVIVDTLSISRLRFSGMGRGRTIELSRTDDWLEFFQRSTPIIPTPTSEALDASAMGEGASAWMKKDRESAVKLEKALGLTPNSEPMFVRKLSEVVAKDDLVYVGNSLPIRWWDLAATREACHPVEANRGVNGIDGQISTALGIAQARASVTTAWILVGDLTALYDLTAPWALLKSLRPYVKTRIVVMNNSGGRIFSRVLSKAPGGAAPFENAHDIGFENWAKMWKLDYYRVCNSSELQGLVYGDHCVIELIPEADSTERFWTEFS